MTSPNASSSETFQPILASDRSSGIPRWLLAGGLGALLFGGGFLAWRLVGARGQGPMGMPPGVTVVVEPVQVGTVEDSSAFLGSLESETGLLLQPEVSGRVTQVFATEGRRVESGTRIVLISPDRIQAEANAAQASVSSAQASVNSAQANVSAARAARESAAATLRSVQARVRELEADLVLSEGDYQRNLTLRNEGAISQQALDIATRDLDASRSAVESAEEEVEAAKATLDQSEATLDQADAALAQAGATLEQAEANRAVAEQNLEDRTVVAPITGTVGELQVKIGDYVTPQTVITNVMENSVLELDIEVPIEERDRLRLGLPVELVATNGDQELASGSITFVSAQANANTQTVLVKAQFENPQGLLKDSQRVEARIVWSTETGVLVPTAAITRLGGQTFVFVAEDGSPEELPPPEAIPPNMPAPEQVARLRPVELGDIQGNNYQVLDGLEPGENIVVSGILNLRDGTPIFPQVEGETSEL